MKKILTLSFILIIIGRTIFPSDLQGQDKLSGQISISGAFALYPMAVKWSEEFRILHPDVRIDISAGGAGKGIADALGGMVEIGMVSREIYPEELKKGAFPVAVTKDAVVAVISESNPALSELLSKGLKKDAGNNIWISGKYTTWAQAFNVKNSSPIHIYTRSDACGAAEMWAKYFGRKQEDLLGVGVFGDPGLAQAVKRDPLGIGFNNIGYAYDAKTKQQVKGLKVVPIDLNNNGKIDEDENFYNSLNDLITAIASGKYPSPPARELYFVCKGNPKDNKVVAEFIKWVLSDGQKFVHEAGYIALPKDKVLTEIKKLE
jgi:phosphate transport system substrate-binding protein